MVSSQLRCRHCEMVSLSFVVTAIVSSQLRCRNCFGEVRIRSILFYTLYFLLSNDKILSMQAQQNLLHLAIIYRHLRDKVKRNGYANLPHAWEKKMSELRPLATKAWEWLVGVPTKLWCKHAFSYYPKCDVLMNNLSESFNSTILQARDKPLITMCEWIRNYLMNRVAVSLTKLDRLKHKIMSMPRKRLDKEVVNHTFDGHQFIVDLSNKKTCTCCFWELVGIPCGHVIAAMSYLKLDPETFVDDCYS
ncbi:uncharacterized protein LOC131651088 [Vicia villosa]|uniref:uncharacterized protein LOC131651088 n=1 Tax=Vicia villosa TaxID=3911 RepID=UPI00273C46A8|nr:uncharacterized protein LOC131651088 [Vicia villosa]